MCNIHRPETMASPESLTTWEIQGFSACSLLATSAGLYPQKRTNKIKGTIYLMAQSQSE